MRADVSVNTCFGTAATVRAFVDPYFASLAARPEEVKRWCRRVLQATADALDHAQATALPTAVHVDPVLASV